MNAWSEIVQYLQTNQGSIYFGWCSALAVWVGKRLWDYLRRRVYNAKYRGFCGKFTVYSFAESGSGDLSEFEYEIRFRFGKLVVSGGSANCRYEGIATATESILYLRLEGVHHVEQIQTVWAKPAHSHAHVLFGTGSAINGSLQPIAYRAILSREKMEKEKAIEMLKSMPTIETDGMIRVERDAFIGERNPVKPAPKSLT